MKNQLIKFFALCAIVCGFIANATAQNMPNTPAATPPMGKMSTDQRVEMRLNKMKQQLNLNDDQTAKVKDLLTAEMTARRSGDKQAMADNHAKMKEEMGKILTPEQMTKYNAMMENQRAKISSGGKN